MGVKFVLIFFLAKFLEPSALGVYGIISASIVLSVIAIGGDFYSFANRELHNNRVTLNFVLKNQILAHIFLYFITLPFVTILFIYGFISWEYFTLFFSILIFEHISQEIYRILVMLERQLLASFLLFLRVSLWGVAVVLGMLFYEQLRTIDFLLQTWFVGVFFVLIVSIYSLFKVVDFTVRTTKVSYIWILRGFKVGFVFFISTLAFKSLLVIDRYAIDYFSDASEVGVYVFFISIIMGVYSFLEPMVFSFIYPKLVKYANENNWGLYRSVLRELVIATVTLSLVFYILLLVLIPYLVDWLDKPEYFHGISIVDTLALAGLYFSLSHIPHYILYSFRVDVLNSLASFGGVLVFIICVFFNKDTSPLLFVSSAIMYAFLFILIFKLIAVFFTYFNKRPKGYL